MPDVNQARLWYPEEDPTHGFSHILRVYRLGEYLAEKEGGNLRIVRAAALLHDAADESNPRQDHHQAAAQFARRILEEENWSEEAIQAVEHCIRVHRFRDQSEKPQTLEAKILFDADKLDAIGAVGVIRALGYALQAGEKIFHPPSKQFLETGKKEEGEPHTPYHEYHYKLRKLPGLLYTRTGQGLAARRRHVMDLFFEQLQQEITGETGVGDPGVLID
ncbi:MAG: HD domain-containing protein [Anaerolineales bacterium]|nr:HD domain-containing protein [Anaerolineales bacterium]